MKSIIILMLLVMFVPYSYAQTCDYKVEVVVNDSEFQKDDFVWKMKATKIDGKPTNITGIAKIEDLSGNIIKNYKPWTNEPISKQKTSSGYSPNLKEGTYKIISEIYIGCNDTNKENNINIKTIRIKSINDINNEIVNKPQEQPIKNESAVSLEDNQKQEINNINYSANFVQDTNSSQNENKTYDKSDAKGQLDQEDDNIIYLQENAQKTDKLIPTANAIKNHDIIYESSNEKSKNLIVFSLLGLSILLNIILIWKR